MFHVQSLKMQTKQKSHVLPTAHFSLWECLLRKIKINKKIESWRAIHSLLKRLMTGFELSKDLMGELSPFFNKYDFSKIISKVNFG